MKLAGLPAVRLRRRDMALKAYTAMRQRRVQTASGRLRSQSVYTLLEGRACA
jgi:hypothetical protein